MESTLMSEDLRKPLNELAVQLYAAQCVVEALTRIIIENKLATEDEIRSRVEQINEEQQRRSMRMRSGFTLEAAGTTRSHAFSVVSPCAAS
jgi:hypothetical protein